MSTRRRVVVFAAVAVVAIGASAFVWSLQRVRYESPLPEHTAELDERARGVIASWDRQHSWQTARRFVPVRPYTPDQRMGWTFLFGHDPRAGRDPQIGVTGGQHLTAAVATLPTTRPDPANVLWQDGAATEVAVVSAAEAFAAVRAEPCRQAPCDGPQLRVTTADLGMVPALTAHGWASVPAWHFTIENSSMRVARIAVAPESNPGGVNDMFYQPGVRYNRVAHGLLTTPRATTAETGASAGPSANALIVQFLGAPSGTGPCQGEYTAHAVEGDSSVVVVIQPMRRTKRLREQEVSCGGLSAFGPLRQQTVYLSRPLGERILLDISDGLPRAVSSRYPLW